MDNDIHNKKWSSSVVKYGKWYLISSILTKGLSILLLPIYTRYLPPHDYGILQTLGSVSAFLPFVLSLSLDSAFGRYFHEDKYSKQALATLYSTVYWFVVGYAIIMLVIAFATSVLWMEDLITVPVWPYAYLTFIPVLFSQLGNLGRTFMQQALETKKSTIVDVISTLINAVISVCLLVFCDLGVISRLLGIAVGSFFMFGFYHLYFVHNGILIKTFSLECLKKCLVYSLPLLPAMMGTWISTLSDRLVIAKYSSLASVGLYSLAVQFGQILYLVGDAITRVIGPLIMSGLIADKDATMNKVRNTSFFILVAMLFSNLMLYVFSEDVVSIFATKQYAAAAVFIPIFGFNYVLGMQQRFPTQIISYKNKTWVISAGCILMALLNLTLNLIFVPIYGYEFSAWASVAANFFYFVWSFAWGQYFEKINYKVIQSLYVTFVFFLLVAVYYYLSHLGLNVYLFYLLKMWFVLLSIVIFAVLYDKNLLYKVVKR